MLLLGLQLDVRLLSHNQIVLCELLLVVVKLLFEHGDLSTSMLFSEVSELVLVLLLELGGLIIEILFLSLNDHVELSLLALDLLDEFLEVGYLLEILDLLGGDFLVEDMLLLLVSDLVLKVGAPDAVLVRAELVLVEEGGHVGILS